MSFAIFTNEPFDWTLGQTQKAGPPVAPGLLALPASGARASDFPATIARAEPPTFVQRIELKKLEAAIGRDLKDVLLDIDSCTSHFFSDGIYCRKWTQPAGSIAVSKTHAKENFILLIAGTAWLTTRDGAVRVTAPHMALTLPGVKRAVFAETDLVILTFHPNPDNEQDMAKLEERFIIPEALGRLEPRP